MALIKCLECGKEMSDTANICPSCGGTNETKVRWYLVFFAVLAVLLMFFILHDFSKGFPVTSFIYKFLISNLNWNIGS